MAKVGHNTKDYCRHCDGRITWVETIITIPAVLGADPDSDERYDTNYRRQWVHADGVKALVEKQDRDAWHCPNKHDHDNDLECTDRCPAYGTEPGGRHRYRRSRAMPKNFCGEQTQTGKWCNRPVVDNDVLACGIHAGDLRAQKAHAERIKEQREFEEYIRKNTEVFVMKLTELGLKTARKGSYGDAGKVIVDADELYRFLISLGADTSKKEEPEDERSSV